MRGSYFLEAKELVVDGTSQDPVAEKWEEEALCILGIAVNASRDCPGSELIVFTAQFSRSLGDVFGPTIAADGQIFSVSLVGIVIYLMVMLSACDPGMRPPSGG